MTVFSSKCVEPVKRLCAGRYGWAVHRFPIKGGKSLADTFLMDKIITEVNKTSWFARNIPNKTTA